MTTIGVIGAGTMGTGIALASALAEYNVVLYDLSEEYLQRSTRNMASMMAKTVERGKLTESAASAARERVTTTAELEGLASCELIIEAAVENLSIKQELFRKLSEMCSPETILASNTSSLSMTAIASASKYPANVLGLHFFNPAHIMKLVEIIRGQETSDEVVERSRQYLKRIGKTAVLAKDTPGFIVNRVARNYYGEAFRIVNDNIADHEQVDRIWKANGMPMGPFQLMDLIGIDVNLAVTESVYAQCFGEPRFRPHLIQQKMVEARRLGKKTGRGFYDYSDSK